jgi:magnesium chelatase accessory protein
MRAVGTALSGSPADDDPAMSTALRWERDGADWPNRTASRFVAAAGLRWHVQLMGEGPPVLLAHGTGATTHSWRALAPILAQKFSVVAPDLPGHGFTQAPLGHELSLPAMAENLAGLLQVLEVRPALVIGHSAGAAILVRMALDGLIAPRLIVSLNGALLPLHGLPGHLFSPLAKLLFTTSLAPRLFAWRARDPRVVRRLLDQSGSTLDDEGIALYARLARTSGHVAAALGMMANWDLDSLKRDLPRLKTRLVLCAAGRDRMIPSSSALQVRRLAPDAAVVPLPELGHLAHEERPDEIAALVIGLAREAGILPSPRPASPAS